MQFKRAKGNFRETDRVVRFKLIKSGKNWLRASTAALGLFRVVRGQVEEMIVAEVPEDGGRLHKDGQQLLKGLVAVGTVFGGAVVATMAQAEEVASLAPTVSETKQETLAEADSVILSKTSSLDSASASLSTSTSLSESASRSLSMSESTSISISGQESTSLASASSESTQVLASETEVDEPAATDAAPLLEQNASEADLLQQIAGKYAAQIPVPERKAALEAVINKLQSEVATSYRFIHTNASAQAYTEQRDRLGKAVDEMMTTLTAAGFVGNSNVNGKPAISAQLSPIYEEVYTAPDVLDIKPNPDDPNGASVEDPTLDTPGYLKDPHLDKDALKLTPEELKMYADNPYLHRYTFGIWEFVNKQGNSLGYYATMSIDTSEIAPDKRKGMDVYFRIVRKSDGAEIFSQTVSPSRTGEEIQLPKEVLIGEAPLGNRVYNSIPSEDNATFGIVTQFIPDQAVLFRSIYDVMEPSNQGKLILTYPRIKIPSMVGRQSTFYREVDPYAYPYTTEYQPTGRERALMEYKIYGLEGQHYTASNPRKFPGYVQVAARNISPNWKSGVFDNSKNGKSTIELLGAAREHFIKSEVVQLNQNGDYSLRYYVLDPSKIHDVSSGDLGNTQVTNVYTLVYEKDFNQDRTDNLTDLGGTRRVESQNKDYFLNVTPRRIDEQHLELDITGWFSTKETVTYTDEKTGIEYTVPKPFTELPSSPSVSNNSTMIVGEDATPHGADGFSNFKQTIKKYVVPYPLISTTYYYRRMTPSESASQSQSFSTSASISESESPTSESASRSQSEANSKNQSLAVSESSESLSLSVSTSESTVLVSRSISMSQSESLVQASVSVSQSESQVRESISVSQSESQVKESVSASQSESQVQASISASQSESQIQASTSASQSDSQVRESISASQSESQVRESTSASQSESLVQASISASQSESQVQASTSASQSESLVQASISASQSESQVQASISASQSESLVQASLSSSQSESQVKESVSASQSESLVQASVSASQSESQVKESVSASQSESQVQASTLASQSELQVQASTSASQSESQVQDSISASQSESQVKESVSASQSESLVKESISASQSESQVQVSTSASQSESQVRE